MVTREENIKIIEKKIAIAPQELHPSAIYSGIYYDIISAKLPKCGGINYSSFFIAILRKTTFEIEICCNCNTYSAKRKDGSYRTISCTHYSYNVDGPNIIIDREDRTINANFDAKYFVKCRYDFNNSAISITEDGWTSNNTMYDKVHLNTTGSYEDYNTVFEKYKILSQLL